MQEHAVLESLLVTVNKPLSRSKSSNKHNCEYTEKKHHTCTRATAKRTKNIDPSGARNKIEIRMTASIIKLQKQRLTLKWFKNSEK